MQTKVIFNCLPPSDKINPSAALSILKSFLTHNNIVSEIIYWNFLLDKYFEAEKKNSDWVYRPVVSLLPYYLLLADEFCDTEALERIKSFYNRLNSDNIIFNRNSFDTFDEVRTEIIDTISTELDKINFENVQLWGISAKCFQWIPGLILSREIKKRNKNTKIVFGGFGGIDDATEVLKSSKDIDFVIYGEGEFPLLELYKVLKNQSSDFSNVPRLIYRENNEIKINQQSKSDFLDYNNYLIPDYSEFFTNAKERYKLDDLRFPINSIRSCRWNKCKFCNYSAGSKYREREPESIVNEIEYISEKYDISSFNFVDNDIIGKDLKRFDKLLDLLIDSSYKNERPYSLWAQFILHKEMESDIYKKMSLAGLRYLFAGYESVSDNLLSKMGKSNSFAHNILYLKFCVKYGIKSDANIIRGIPGETAEDVNEASKNLHYLRFYFHGRHLNFAHTFGNFTLYKDTKFNKSVTDDEKQKLHLDTFYSYLPNKLLNEPFNIFGLVPHRLENYDEWFSFTNVEDYYKAQKFHYDILLHQNIVYYKEYLNELEINTIVFDEPEYIETLKLANNKVISFDTLKINLKSLFPEITDERITKIITDLKSVFLLYASDDYSTIVTVIDMSLLS